MEGVINWTKTRPVSKLGQIILRHDDGRYAQLSHDGLWDLPDVHAQESVSADRRRFFHTALSEKNVSPFIKQIRAYWEQNYAPTRGYWDNNDVLVFKFGKKYLVHIPDIVFQSALDQLNFVTEFNAIETHIRIPFEHLSLASYRWPIVNQTVKGVLVIPIQGGGATDTYNGVVIDYDNE